MNELLDAGAPWQDTVYDWADRHPDWRSEIRDWHDNWIKLAAPLIPHSLRLMRALKTKGIPVFALTNFGAESFAYARREYMFLNEFDREYVSGRMKVTKPDPAIYQMVEQDCGIAPERLLFTDDRAENISAAEARGWQTHLFEQPKGLADRLVALGLLTPTEAL
jgi:2-haloacid dehalogenase